MAQDRDWQAGKADWNPRLAESMASELLDLTRGVGMDRGQVFVLDLVYRYWQGIRGASIPMASRSSELEHRLEEVCRHTLERHIRVNEPGFLAAVYEALLVPRNRSAGERVTPDSIATLISNLVGDPRSVIDPACGVGGILRSCSALPSRPELHGIEINADIASVASRRFEMGGFKAEIETGDAFEVAAAHVGRHDAVVLQPPWGMLRGTQIEARWGALGINPSTLPNSATRSDFGWIELALRLLASDGRAAVVLPRMGGKLHADEVARLLSIGVVEAVVSIPAFAFPNVGIATNLWLLRGRSAVLREAVLVVNGAAFADGGRGARQSFREEAIDKIVNIVQSWRSERLVQTEAHIAMAVPVEVIDPASGIDPQAVLEAPPIEDDICPDPPGHLMSHLTLGGFKSFGPKVTVPLAPLTLVFGANSAGKSTIVQSLLLLRQSLQSRGLVTQGPDANVGSIAGAAHKHASDEVCLGFGFSAPMWELPSAGTPDPSLPREIEFRFAAGPGQRGELRLMRTKFGQHDVTLTPFSDREEFALRFAEVRDVFEELALGTLLYPFDTRQARSDNPGEEANRSRQRRNHGRSIHRRAAVDELRLRGEGLLPTGRIVDDVNTSRTSERSSSVLKSYADRMARLAAGVGVEAQTILASLTHLGPLRSAPRRFYDRGGGAVPGDGRDVALFLFDNSAITEHVNQWLTTLEVPYLLDVLPVQVAGISDLVGDLVALTLTDSRSKVTVTPADVGFGISQVLPIVVELLAKTESLICVEQPETHLHPRLQARLADLFIESTSLAGRRNQLIVETHSEHLMLRVQRRIREGVVSPEQVKVLYVDQDEDGVAYVKPLRLDERGDFMDEWPAGFFDERLDDLIGGLL